MSRLDNHDELFEEVLDLIKVESDESLTEELRILTLLSKAIRKRSKSVVEEIEEANSDEAGVDLYDSHLGDGMHEGELDLELE